MTIRMPEEIREPPTEWDPDDGPTSPLLDEGGDDYWDGDDGGDWSDDDGE